MRSTSPLDDLPSLVSTRIVRVSHEGMDGITDMVAVEEPLELRLGFGPPADRSRRTVSITMRTPGHDEELALGFLYTEGLFETMADVLAVTPLGQNIVRVDLHPGVDVNMPRLERHVYTTSSCGVCGKTSLEAIEHAIPFPLGKGPVVSARWVRELPAQLRTLQPAFARSGGLHAAALFPCTNEPPVIREDVGRHNALDKVIGAMLRAGSLPLQQYALVLSGRASFELVQKAAMAGVPLLIAVGAPSSLAIDLARRVGMTLAGFVREDRMNIYSGEERITHD